MDEDTQQVVATALSRLEARLQEVTAEHHSLRIAVRALRNASSGDIRPDGRHHVGARKHRPDSIHYHVLVILRERDWAWSSSELLEELATRKTTLTTVPTRSSVNFALYSGVQEGTMARIGRGRYIAAEFMDKTKSKTK